MPILQILIDCLLCVFVLADIFLQAIEIQLNALKMSIAASFNLVIKGAPLKYL